MTSYERHGVWNYQENSPDDRWIPAHRPGKAKGVFMSWRNHDWKPCAMLFYLWVTILLTHLFCVFAKEPKSKVLTMMNWDLCFQFVTHILGWIIAWHKMTWRPSYRHNRISITNSKCQNLCAETGLWTRMSFGYLTITMCLISLIQLYYIVYNWLMTQWLSCAPLSYIIEYLDHGALFTGKHVTEPKR